MRGISCLMIAFQGSYTNYERERLLNKQIIIVIFISAEISKLCKNNKYMQRLQSSFKIFFMHANAQLHLILIDCDISKFYSIIHHIKFKEFFIKHSKFVNNIKYKSHILFAYDAFLPRVISTLSVNILILICN